MNSTRAIFSRELKGFFNSPMAYIFLVIFALVNGYFFTNTFFLFGQSDLRALFDIVPLVYLFFIPAVLGPCMSSSSKFTGCNLILL